MAELIFADTFFPATTRLSPQEQSQINAFVVQFQRNPANPGISLERLDRVRARNLWSGRISRDVRAILCKDGDTWALLYVDHHNPAYRWAERRTASRHPVTGALQVFKAVETVEEVKRIVEIPVAPEAPPLFQSHADEYLLSLGVPEDWLPVLREVRSDDQLLEVCAKLPEEIGERLWDLADGKLVTPPTPISASQPVTSSPDTQRRFYVAEDEASLIAALNAPMEKWIAFLHPSQRTLVQGDFRGPLKVTGSAGTGKTVVAMHRARHLARKGRRVLLTSYVTTLCSNIDRNLRLFCSDEELRRIKVSTVHSDALAIVRSVDPRVQPASANDIQSLLSSLARRFAPGFDAAFVRAEWESVIQVQGIRTWPEYRSARRVGRGKALTVRDRRTLWDVFEGVIQGLENRNLADWPGLCCRAEELLNSGKALSNYDAVVVDEIQDLKPPEIRFLKALCGDNLGDFMLVGDAGQRIYPGGFSLSSIGVETRGRSHILRINYRTTEQIRRAADQLLGLQSDDMDGGSESRKGTRSLLKGPKPSLTGYANLDAELNGAVEQVKRWLGEGLKPEAIGLFARTRKQVDQLQEALEVADIKCQRLAENETAVSQHVHLGTMHRAKGLEFKAVLLVNCANGSVPNPQVLRGVEDPQDREEAVARERRVLYVVMTRARDELHVTWAGEGSPFLKELRGTGLVGDK